MIHRSILSRSVFLACLSLLLIPEAHAQVDLTVKTGHVDAIRSLAFSPDGSYLATVGDDKTVRIWNVQSGQEIRVLGAHTTAVTVVAFSPNNQLLAAVSHAEGLVKVWNIKDGRQLWASDTRVVKYSFPGDQRHTIAFSPNGEYLAVGQSTDKSRGPEMVSIVMPEPILLSPAPVPPRQRPGESEEDYEKRYQEIKDKAAEEEKKRLDAAAAKEKADQERILLENAIMIWKVDSGRKVKELIGHTGGVPLLVFSNNGQTLISASEDRTIRLWDFATAKEMASFKSSETIEYLTLSQSNRFLACLIRGKKLPGMMKYENSEIRIWDLQTGQQSQSFQVEDSGIIQFDPEDESTLLNISRQKIDYLDTRTAKRISTLVRFNNQWMTESKAKLENERYVQSIKKGEIKFPRPTPSSAQFTAAFDSRGQRFALSDWRDTYVWNWQTKKLISEFKSKILPPGNFLLSPDGKVLAIEEDGYKLVLLNLQSEVMKKNLSSSWANLAFSPDSRLIAVCERDYSDQDPEVFTSSIKLLKAQTGNLVRSLGPVKGNIEKLAFDRSGKMLASQGGYNNPDALTIWEVESARPIRSVPANSADAKYPEIINFSANGKLLLFSDSGKQKFWDIEANVIGIISAYGSPNRIAFSKDGVWTVESVSNSKALILKNLKSGFGWFLAKNDQSVIQYLLKIIPEYYQNNQEDVITPDGKWRVIKTSDGKLRFLDLKSGKPVADLINIGENWLGADSNWLVTTPAGFFDGTPAAWRQLLWRFNNDTFDYDAVELYFNDFFYPGLLQDVLAGKSPNRPAGSELARIDRRQPKVEITSINEQATPTTTESTTDKRIARVVVEVADNIRGKKQAFHPDTSGAQGLRLFRNGSLVKVWHGDAFNIDAIDKCEQIVPSNRNEPRRVRCRADVSVTAGSNGFTAYAFNSSNVKSSDATAVVMGADSLKRSGTLYVLVIGVANYANPKYNLSYSVADARAFGSEFQRHQAGVGVYQRVELIQLLDREAKKANILAELKALTGKVQPEDAVVVYFSGHGTAREDRYYLIPHDLGYRGSRKILNSTGLKTILSHSISDRDLEAAFRDIDAGRLLLIIDACNSGQALDAEQKRRGPMNSKGLAQLAYEKGMYVLTASQAFESAFESNALKHSYLTYALVEEGLKSRLQETDANGDGQVWLREWFDYAAQRVPEMHDERTEQTARLHNKLLEAVGFTQRRVQTPRVFYRSESDLLAWTVAKSK